jgi:hypothetical protein
MTWPLSIPYRRVHELALTPAPMAPISLCDVHSGEIRHSTWGLVDTGADTTGFPLDVLHEFGLTPADLIPIHGMTGNEGPGVAFEYPPGVELVVAGDQRIRVTGHFLPVGLPCIALGREDFFRAFAVELDQRAARLTLWPHDDAATCNDDLAERLQLETVRKH